MRGDINNHHRVGEINDDLGAMRREINGNLHVMCAEIKNNLGIIRRDINLLKWMNGITWALLFGILFKLFLH
jgi:hypothetical protein